MTTPEGVLSCLTFEHNLSGLPSPILFIALIVVSLIYLTVILKLIGAVLDEAKRLLLATERSFKRAFRLL